MRTWRVLCPGLGRPGIFVHKTITAILLLFEKWLLITSREGNERKLLELKQDLLSTFSVPGPLDTVSLNSQRQRHRASYNAVRVVMAGRSLREVKWRAHTGRKWQRVSPHIVLLCLHHTLTLACGRRHPINVCKMNKWSPQKNPIYF